MCRLDAFLENIDAQIATGEDTPTTRLLRTLPVDQQAEVVRGAIARHIPASIRAEEAITQAYLSSHTNS